MVGCGLTGRSTGAPTAGHQARAAGTRYIVCGPGLASTRRRPVNSALGPATPNHNTLMPPTILPFVLALALTLPGCTTTPPPGPWYQGAFAGQFNDGPVRNEITVKCSESRACSLRIAPTSGPTSAKPNTAATSSAPLVLATIPNNNLDFVRRAVRQDPNLFNDPVEGPLLAPLKSALSDGDRLTECLDVSTDSSKSLLLCSRASDSSARSSVLLLLITMKPTCSRGAFCAYYFVPLNRSGA